MSLWNSGNILDVVSNATETASDLAKNGVPVLVIVEKKTIVNFFWAGIGIAFCAAIFKYGIAKLFGKNGS